MSTRRFFIKTFKFTRMFVGSDQANSLIWQWNDDERGSVLDLEHCFCCENEPFKIFSSDHNRNHTTDKRIVSWNHRQRDHWKDSTRWWYFLCRPLSFRFWCGNQSFKVSRCLNPTFTVITPNFKICWFPLKTLYKANFGGETRL